MGDSLLYLGAKYYFNREIFLPKFLWIIRQQILSPTQQQTSLYPSATTLKTSISRPPSSTVVSNTSKDEMNQLKHASQSTVTSTSTNTISYAAHYITTTPTKVVNLARTAAAGHSQGSGATATILTPVVSSAAGTVVRSLQGAGGNGGSQQGSVVQYQHITSHKQQVVFLTLVLINNV